jgi:hypothetical protein
MIFAASRLFRAVKSTMARRGRRDAAEPKLRRTSPLPPHKKLKPCVRVCPLYPRKRTSQPHENWIGHMRSRDERSKRHDLMVALCLQVGALFGLDAAFLAGFDQSMVFHTKGYDEIAEHVSVFAFDDSSCLVNGGPRNPFGRQWAARVLSAGAVLLVRPSFFVGSQNQIEDPSVHT